MNIRFVKFNAHNQRSREIRESVITYKSKKNLTDFYDLDVSIFGESAFCHSGSIGNRNLLEVLFSTSRKVFLTNFPDMRKSEILQIFFDLGFSPLDCKIVKVRCGRAPENCAYIHFKSPDEVKMLLENHRRIFLDKVPCLVDIDLCDPDKDEVFRYRLREKKRRKKRSKRDQRLMKLEERINEKYSLLQKGGTTVVDKKRASILQNNQMAKRDSPKLDNPNNSLTSSRPRSGFRRASLFENLEICHLKPSSTRYWIDHPSRLRLIETGQAPEYLFKKGFG